MLTTSSVVAEGDGVKEGGSTDSEIEEELSVESISSTEPRHKLAEATLADTMFATARTLADNNRKGTTGQTDWSFAPDLRGWGTTWNNCVCLHCTETSVCVFLTRALSTRDAIRWGST